MTTFEQFIFTYFIFTTALAGFAILWRNWLEDHESWREWFQKIFGTYAKALTCGSCFTFWITLAFVVVFDPLDPFIHAITPRVGMVFLSSYFIQWMSLGWGALFLRFLYIHLQESVSRMVHGSEGHHH